MSKETGEGHNSKKSIDFVGAAEILKGKIAKLKDDSAKSRGDLSAQWAKIEEMGVNKKAAKAVQSMLGQSPSTVSDYLRTFVALLEPCGLGILRDMVDDAEGKSGIVVPLIDTQSVDA